MEITGNAQHPEQLVTMTVIIIIVCFPGKGTQKESSLELLVPLVSEETRAALGCTVTDPGSPRLHTPAQTHACGAFVE